MRETHANAHDVAEIESASEEHLERKKKKTQILSFVNAYIEIRQKATSGDSVSDILQEALDLLRHEKLLQNGG